MSTDPVIADLSRLSTGVEALDRVLGGGFPTLSTTIISGEPGTGKTILMLQILFHLARRGKKCLYFTTRAHGGGGVDSSKRPVSGDAVPRTADAAQRHPGMAPDAARRPSH